MPAQLFFFWRGWAGKQIEEKSLSHVCLLEPATLGKERRHTKLSPSSSAQQPFRDNSACTHGCTHVPHQLHFFTTTWCDSAAGFGGCTSRHPSLVKPRRTISKPTQAPRRRSGKTDANKKPFQLCLLSFLRQKLVEKASRPVH